jgi:hypothetical protein
VVGNLTCLRKLTLRNMGALQSPRLHMYLLPLPTALRKLEQVSHEVLPG